MNKETITWLLERYREAGLGGVEVTTVYGVKGQEAHNIDYLSPQWVEMIKHTSAIDHFEPVFKDLAIRAQFHDSWEYESTACPEIFDRLLEMRGYDVRDHLDALAGDATPDLNARVRYDYQLTLAELALDEFIAPWAAWCHELTSM